MKNCGYTWRTSPPDGVHRHGCTARLEGHICEQEVGHALAEHVCVCGMTKWDVKNITIKLLAEHAFTADSSEDDAAVDQALDRLEAFPWDRYDIDIEVEYAEVAWVDTVRALFLIVKDEDPYPERGSVFGWRDGRLVVSGGLPTLGRRRR